MRRQNNPIELLKDLRRLAMFKAGNRRVLQGRRGQELDVPAERHRLPDGKSQG
jgi:hypothetical protein